MNHSKKVNYWIIVQLCAPRGIILLYSDTVSSLILNKLWYNK